MTSIPSRALMQDVIDEYQRYRLIGERALAQIPDEALNEVHAPDGNSAAMIVYHMAGNLASRFTDFLDSDGEKPWRQRDAEFDNRFASRSEVEAQWAAGWGVLDEAIRPLTDGDLLKEVRIRRKSLSVHGALCRSVGHMAYHVGQIVLIARMTADADWKWISIPKGGSDTYNANPVLEKRPD